MVVARGDRADASAQVQKSTLGIFERFSKILSERISNRACKILHHNGERQSYLLPTLSSHERQNRTSKLPSPSVFPTISTDFTPTP
jgi:hypothetical protein